MPCFGRVFFEYQVAGIKYQDASRSKMQEPREDWKYRRNKLEIIRASSGNKNLYFNPFSRSEAESISILFPPYFACPPAPGRYFVFLTSLSTLLSPLDYRIRFRFFLPRRLLRIQHPRGRLCRCVRQRRWSRPNR